MRLPVLHWLFSTPAGLFYCLATAGLHKSLGSPPGLAIYGVEGVVTFTVEGRAVDIGPGESCFVARGAVHGFNNLKQTAVKALAIITPALLGPDFFKEAAAIVNVGGPPDVEKLKAVMAKHGLVPAMRPVAS